MLHMQMGERCRVLIVLKVLFHCFGVSKSLVRVTLLKSLEEAPLRFNRRFYSRYKEWVPTKCLFRIQNRFRPVNLIFVIF